MLDYGHSLTSFNLRFITVLFRIEKKNILNLKSSVNLFNLIFT